MYHRKNPDLVKQILKLRSKGKTYGEIAKTVGLHKSTVAYHCCDGTKRQRYRRSVVRRLEYQKSGFSRKFSKYSTKLVAAVSSFQVSRRLTDEEKLNKNRVIIKWQDVIEKFGWETSCYLTGKPIDLHKDDDYALDHIHPRSRGGKSILDNMGVTKHGVNQAKSDKTVEEFLELCKEVLEFNGYEVTKKDDVA